MLRDTPLSKKSLVLAPFFTSGAAQLNVQIVFDDESLHSLRQSIPAGSRFKPLIESAVKLKRLGGDDVIVLCDAAEVRHLLLYAGHCPDVVAAIHKALRDAGLPIGAD